MDTLPGDGTAPVAAAVPGPGPEEAIMTDATPYVVGENPGANPSRIDPRDWYASQLTATLPPGEAGAPPPLASADVPLGPTLLQSGGSCVAFGFAGALQHALWTILGRWISLEVLEFFGNGGGNLTYGWEIAQALAFAKSRGIYVVTPGAPLTKLVKVQAYYRVAPTLPDCEVAIYQGTRHKGWSPLLWETAWPNQWFAPAKGTGLLEPGARDAMYGHLTYLWRYVPRIYGAEGVVLQGRNSWGTDWGIGGGNYSVQGSDVLAPELRWGLWQFTVDPSSVEGL